MSRQGMTVEDYLRMNEQKASKHCPQCHIEVDDADRFCRYCGEPLSNVKSGVLLDLERAKQEKEESSLLFVGLAFAVGGIFAGHEADTFLKALLNTLIYGGGALLIGGILWVALHVLHSFVTDGREGGFGIKAIFCIIVAVASAAISFFW